uniref:Uncharacterized protein n=1 Tax=Aegilops tauschii subsp. strangulata TaxID=200361 RepID=A0A452Z0W5_AEGTS
MPRLNYASGPLKYSWATCCHGQDNQARGDSRSKHHTTVRRSWCNYSPVQYNMTLYKIDSLVYCMGLRARCFVVNEKY